MHRPHPGRLPTLRALTLYLAGTPRRQYVPAVKAGEAVVEVLTTEAIERIDHLTHCLGRYPRVDTTRGADPLETGKGFATMKPVSTSCDGTITASRPPIAASNAKRARMERLQQRIRSVSSPIRPNLQTPTAAARRTTPPPLFSVRHSNAEDLASIRPYTPLTVVSARLEVDPTSQGRPSAGEDYEDTELTTKEEAEDRALLTHPPHMWSDEVSIAHRFGMGGRAAPAHQEGFTGLFRQHWFDFCVTEMVADPTVGCVGRLLSRELDVAIPSLPDALLHSEGAKGLGGPASGFFEVDVAARLEEIRREFVNVSANAEKESASSDTTAADDTLAAHRSLLQQLSDVETALPSREELHDAAHSRARFFLQCTLHKQHIAHSVAMGNVAQTLRVHPRALSVAGIKDYIGDTVQRIRIENVSPAAARQANSIFARRGWKMRLANFSYEKAPLAPGDLAGNHFVITLRDVTAPRAVIQDAMHSLQKFGFPNYYGCQRFAWFGGSEDPAFALLRGNWLAFAFRFLNYTARDRSLRELLQRPHKYPNNVQDEYRRRVVRRLRQIAIDPGDLDVAPFLSCPPFHEKVCDAGGNPLSKQQELIVWQLREAFFDLHLQSRRLTAQRLSSYLWNQVLTLRLHHFPSDQVLMGDMVAPEILRHITTEANDRRHWFGEYGDVVDESNIEQYSIRDVLHPGFMFDGVRLPDNAVGAYYLQTCERYCLDWYTRHSATGLIDFREAPRPIIRHPIDLRYEYDAAGQKLTVSFALERGCYANVAITELMKAVRCVGSEDILTLPAPEALWEKLGKQDPGYVTSLQDIYADFEDGVGTLRDVAEPPLALESETKVWDMEGPWFLPQHEDPCRKAHAWGSRNLLRSMERRVQDAQAMSRRLFEKPLADRMEESEVGQYAGHTVPRMPNARGKRIFFKVLRRQQRYTGAPRQTLRIKRGAQVQNRNHRAIPAFKTLNRNSWNVTW